jgi:hypothetical protein
MNKQLLNPSKQETTKMNSRFYLLRATQIKGVSRLCFFIGLQSLTVRIFSFFTNLEPRLLALVLEHLLCESYMLGDLPRSFTISFLVSVINLRFEVWMFFVELVGRD